MTSVEKFNAAVNVIRSLPKNGSYQPSTELMLRFYGYFKQATEGPNKTPKPSFWEIVKKAKWDAWNKLGEMSKQDAMDAYVEELNKIVETMAFTENVADFLTSMDSFYNNLSQEDIELCMGPTLEKVRSAPGSPLSNSPFGSREASPLRTPKVPEHNNTIDLDVPEHNNIIDLDEDDDYFLDSVETIPMSEKEHVELTHSSPIVVTNGVSTNSLKNQIVQDSAFEILQRTVSTLHKEVNELNETIRKLENKQKALLNRQRSFFGGMSKETVAFILLWPIVYNIGLRLFLRNRNRSQSNILL